MEERDKSVVYKVTLDTFEQYFTIHLPLQADTVADLKKSLIGHLYPYSPVYNYMDGYSVDKMDILSAATGEVLDAREKLQWYHSHAATQVGKEYVLKLYNQNGNQHTMQDFLEGQLEYPPPMTEYTAGYDHDIPDTDIHSEQPISKRRRYN